MEIYLLSFIFYCRVYVSWYNFIDFLSLYMGRYWYYYLVDREMSVYILNNILRLFMKEMILIEF